MTGKKFKDKTSNTGSISLSKSNVIPFKKPRTQEKHTFTADKPTAKRIREEIGCFFPDVDLQEWCKEWSLEIKSRVCPECERTVFTTIPFETKEYKALTTPDCKCGYETRTAVCHVYCKKLKKKFEKVFTEIDNLNLI